MQKLSGKTALITGGNSGIGLATAKLFSEHGANLVITGRDKVTLEEARASLSGEVLAIQSDAGKIQDIDSLMRQVQERFSQIDILFVNAAIARPAPFDAVTETGFDETVDINFKGAYFTIQKALPLLAKGSSIVITTSMANQVGAANFGVYAACKAALRSLTHTLGLELIDRGIRVNAVSPGPIDTPGFGRWGDVPKEVVDTVKTDFTQRSPVKRFGTPEEIAKAVLFLSSEDASYIVGTELVIDGGFTLLL